MKRIHLIVKDRVLNRFTSLLEKGVGLSVTAGCTFRELLCDQLGLSDEYLNRRIQTLFLNARPVDDVDRTLVQDGAIIALSSAMPGILGATMRKGGKYAAFRKSISQQETDVSLTPKKGHVTLKMFNMVAKEIGIHLLQTGVEVRGTDLYRVVAKLPEKLENQIQNMCLNGKAVEPSLARFNSILDEPINLSIDVKGGN